MARSPRLSIALLVVAAACEPRHTEATVEHARDATALPTASARPADARPAAPDLDPEAALRALACPNAAAVNACRIVREFAPATRKVTGAPSGNARYLGMGYRVDKGKEAEEPEMLSVVTIPTQGLGPDDLPLRIALEPLPREPGKEGRLTELILRNGHSVPSKSHAILYLKGWISKNASTASITRGASVRLLTQNVFLRQSDTGTILVVGPSSTGDGIYAELRPITW